MKLEPGEGAWLVRLIGTPRRRLTVLTVLGVAALFRVAQFAFSVSGRAWGYDFSAYFLAGKHVLQGQSLYTAAQLAGPFPPQEQFAYLYPPLLAVLVAPLSAVFADFHAGMWFWSAAELFVLVASTAVLVRQRRLPALVFVVLLTAALALPQVTFELLMGNVHLLLAGLFVVAWVGLERDAPSGDVIAGVAIGTATLIKVFPGVLLIWLVATGRYRAALLTIATIVALAAATIPFVGFAAWLDYIRVLLNLGPPVEPWTSISPTALVSDLTGFTIARIIVATLCVAAMLWAAFTRSAVISFAVAVSVSILIIPTMYPHSLALAVAPLLLFAVGSTSGIGASLAYLGVFAAGQAALFDLRVPLFRGIAALGLPAPLAVLIATTARSHRPFRSTAQAET